ncbi:alginate lyase [Pseudonocardia hierapolitana]|uniref:Alginate lyase n=1 Tax=Pseudonocardia hierapolitana TaxID=1128676 RepID=A0A561SWZ2_9PSEU|nr:polysaccharide lyase family 7 protein [Pseudonocardia hierapolitana]TWF79380.1 alginate lyase [Pseudonocardia hierapolitana]
MPDLIAPVAVAVAAVLTVQPVPAPHRASLDPCTLVVAAAPGLALPGPPSCPLPVIPEAEPPRAQGAATKPGDLLDLANWFLTLPVGPEGDPDSIDQPELLDYRSDWFDLTPDGTGVVFRAPAGGVTTKNSKYSRSELREMRGEEKAAWSNTKGVHTLESRQAITKVPSVKPEVSATQIHDGGDDVMQIRLEGSTLVAQYADGAEQVVIDQDYRLGTPYDLRIVAADGRITVFYDGEQRAEIERSGSSWYWKVGAYTQSNPERGDDPDALGEVVVYSLRIEHTDG